MPIRQLTLVLNLPAALPQALETKRVEEKERAQEKERREREGNLEVIDSMFSFRLTPRAVHFPLPKSPSEPNTLCSTHHNTGQRSIMI